ncbi:MAG: polymer-forming cytoskeletal protein [Elusimicrobiota bacterium]|jgi:cytoskeletal protein CcmA (bactofilin family)|nr:polymer-forming cytoskeletal protein [Elusimicrobiota bacterium]
MTKKSTKNLLETVETIIGQNAVFEGNIKTDKVVRIDGKLMGNVEAAGILIGADAQIVGDISTDVIMIGGKVKANISAKEYIEILPTAVVVGDIKTNILTIAEGAHFDGKSSMTVSDDRSVNEGKNK